MISKSPILEPLRNRPKRSAIGNSSVNTSINGVLGEKSNTLLAKKTTKKTSKLNLMEDIVKIEVTLKFHVNLNFILFG